MLQCKGFLFDLDGTLVDSLPAVERAWVSWAERRGIDADRVLGFIHGKQAITSLRHFMPGASEAEIQQEFVALEQIEAADTDGITPIPGALNLLHRLDELDIPWAIVTSGSIPVARARHRHAGLPEPRQFITAEQIPHGKPAPDAYLVGAASLGFTPAECIVMEDAPAGITAGLTAGSQVIAINSPKGTSGLERCALVLRDMTRLVAWRNGDGTICLRIQS